MKQINRFSTIVLAVLLASCASDPLKTASSTSASGTGNNSSSESVAGGNTGNYPTVTPDQERSRKMGPLNDPNSPLSKRSIYYDYDSFVIKETYKPLLKAHAEYLLKNKDEKLIIQGNTDERGSREYNLALGQKRAEGVRQAFKLLGVSDNQIEAVSFGEEKPKNTESTEAGWAENRRSDLAYQGE
ncbi:MAG: peptidoglycan-associated lipoprotein Pal [Pseudomonadota bacterium]